MGGNGLLCAGQLVATSHMWLPSVTKELNF